jgi:hypothetical protein
MTVNARRDRAISAASQDRVADARRRRDARFANKVLNDKKRKKFLFL